MSVLSDKFVIIDLVCVDGRNSHKSSLATRYPINRLRLEDEYISNDRLDISVLLTKRHEVDEVDQRNCLEYRKSIDFVAQEKDNQ